MGATRWSEAPDTPTFREQGFDVVQGSMRGLAAPAGVPAEVLDRLARSARAVIEDAEFRRIASQQSLPLRFLGPKEFATMLQEERRKMQALWQEHPWKQQ
jgi:tripartite-type tricarboxylate transporter receptor subunit TctC